MPSNLDLEIQPLTTKQHGYIPFHMITHPDLTSPSTKCQICNFGSGRGDGSFMPTWRKKISFCRLLQAFW